MDSKSHKQLQEAYEEAKRLKEKARVEIDSIIAKFDNIELLSCLWCIWYTGPADEPSIDRIRERAHLHFITGLCLKNKNRSNNLPTGTQVTRIRELVLEYFDHYSMELSLGSAVKADSNKTESTTFEARNYELLNQINYGAYQFQFDEYNQKIFGQMDSHFLDKVGFTLSDAVNFSKKIVARYGRRYNDHVCEVREIVEENRRKMNDPKMGEEVRRFYSENKMNPEEALNLYAQYLMYYGIKRLFLFKPEDFCRDEDIDNVERFKNYLRAFSCKFEKENVKFDAPLDRNIIFTRPIIDNEDGNYFCPIPLLLYDWHSIFPTFLDDNIRNHTSIAERYKELKTSYVENKIEECFLRIFPRQTVFKNLKYKYQGKELEVDGLIAYDNKIFLIEGKSGALTESARRGAPERLRSDLRDLVAKAYEQGKRTIDYVKSTSNAEFRDKKGKVMFRIDSSSEELEFFVINVTLVTLRGWATSLKDLDVLGLFSNNEYPWSVSTFDLDIIARHIRSPSFMIHYLEQRLKAQNENIFKAFSELEYLGWYLRYGNFYRPQINGKKPDFVMMDASIGEFDDCYLYGKDPPKLNIDPDTLEIIGILEELCKKGYSTISSRLLDLYKEQRMSFFKMAHEKIAKTRNDGQVHFFSGNFQEPVELGITFVCKKGRQDLQKKLIEISTIVKYKFKTRVWLGIGKDVDDNDWFMNDFLYIESEWAMDPDMDKLVNKLGI